MYYIPIQYNEPVFRPPAESNSVIIQATIGCSWNKCAFCEMYTSKSFMIRPIEDIHKDILVLANYYRGTKKIFLADGNAFILSPDRLIQILEFINKSFGKLQRISAYALPQDILRKSDSQLRDLRDLGLKLLYIGIETGYDELLQRINKGETAQTTREGILKAHEAGIETSVMILNGLGGNKYSEQHAIQSAYLINDIQPKFLSTLTLSFPFGISHFQQKFNGNYQQQTIVELAEELKLFINNLALNNTIFRSDHISNNLILKGTLQKDKNTLIDQIQFIISQTDKNEHPRYRGIL